MATAVSSAVDLGQAFGLTPTPPGDWLVIAPTVITGLGGSLLLMLRKVRWLQAPLAIAILALLVLATGGLFLRVLDGGPVVMTMGRWLPPFGITFAADLLGATFALAASIVSLLVAVFAVGDVPVRLHRYGFYPFLVMMMMGVCGAFLTGDIFNLYVWFEVLLIASFGLIVLGNSTLQLDGAVRYALLNLIATTLFLIAVGYLYGTLGTLNMADIAARVGELDDIAPITTIAALFILAFGMKAAAFPLHFWLPASYHVPAASASAIFAGLLTKVGIYALIRTLVMLMPDELGLYSGLLAWVAIGTMAIGAFGAMSHTDLRRVAGYFVITGIGTILAGVAVANAGGISGAIVYAVHSMITVSAIYLVVGLISRLAGSPDIRTAGGLYAASPFLAALVLVLFFSQAGLPPLSGFWPKVMITQAALQEGHWVLAGAILASGFLTTIAGSRAFAHVFWRGGPAGTPDGTAVPLTVAIGGRQRNMLTVPIVVAAAFVLLIGLWPGPLMEVAFAAAGGVLDSAGYVGAVLGTAQ